VADGGDTTGVGLDFDGELRSPVATTCEVVRADDAFGAGATFGAGAPIMTSSTASGSAAANTSHGGAGRKPAVARNNVKPAMCNRRDVIVATTSSNTDHGRVAATWALGAFFGLGGAVMSAWAEM
jgi:N-acetylmuramic acid 6-phosphate (MurNAc-6-P) etherase